MKRIIKCDLYLCIVALFSCIFLLSCGETPLVTDGETLSNDNSKFEGVMNVYIDASSSMRGFIDVPSSCFKDEMPIIISDLRKNLVGDNNDKQNYYIVKEWNATVAPISMNWSGFKDCITTASNYTGQNTILQNLISNCGNNLRKDDIAIVVTDGVLSMGKAKLSQSPNGNADFLGDLSREVKEAMDGLYTKKLDIAIMRTTCNYNGYYYCNCKEEDKITEFKDSIMRNRPLYYIMMGNRHALSKAISAIQIENIDTAEAKYKLSYFSNSSIEKLKYSIIESNEGGSGIDNISFVQVNDTLEDKSTIQISLELDYFSDESPVKFYLCLPSMSENMVGKIDSVLGNCPNDFIASAVKVKKTDCQKNVGNYSNDFWKQFGLFYKITLKKASEIRSTNMENGKLFLMYEDPLSADSLSINCDIGKHINELENKTFGWGTFVEAIKRSSYNKNMCNKKSKIGTININFKTN